MPNRLEEAGISWVILGSQTKPYKPPKIEWVREIVQAADKAGVKVFLKKNLKPLIESQGMLKGQWAAKEWVMCKYPVLRDYALDKGSGEKYNYPFDRHPFANSSSFEYS